MSTRALRLAVLLGTAASMLGSLPDGTADPADSTSTRLSAPALHVVDRIRDRVAVVRTEHSNSRGFSAGFLVAPRMVLTAAHVVSGLTRATAWVKGVAYSADVAAVHPNLDVALLRLHAPAQPLEPVTLSSGSAALHSGDELVVVAGPSQPAAAAAEPAERRARAAQFESRVVQRNAEGRLGPVLALRGATERGDSGSPVARPATGEVVGILVDRELSDERGVSHRAYAVPADAFQSWLTAVLRSETAPPTDDFYLDSLTRER